MTMTITVKVIKHKSGLSEHTESMCKYPKGSVYIDNIFCNLIYLPDPFPRGLEVDQEGRNTFPILALLIHIDILGLLCHL